MLFPAEVVRIRYKKDGYQTATRLAFKEEPAPDSEFESIRRIYAYDRTPLNPAVESSDTTDVWIHRTVTFDAAYGDGDERVILHLYLPRDTSPPYQTIVFYPGSNAIHDREYDEGVRFVMGFLDFLVLDGRAFAFPVYKGTYERGTDLDTDYQEMTVRYRDHVTWWVKDLRRTVDYLETRDDVDAGNLAYFGWSWGGMLGPLMTALEPRIKTQILLVAGLMMQSAPRETDVWHFLPRVTAPTPDKFVPR